MKISLRKCILYGVSVHRYLDFVLMFLLTLFNFRYVRIQLLVATMALGVVSVCTITYLGYPYGKFVQQFVLLAISVLGYDIYLKKYAKDYFSVFLYYMRLAYILSIVTYIQFFIFLLTGRDVFYFLLTTAESARVHAWLSEPGWYAAFMTPAISYLIYDKRYRETYKWRFVAMLLSYLLSLSALAYFAMLLIFVQWLYSRYRKIMMTLFVLGVSIVITFFAYASTKKINQSDYSFDNSYIGSIIGKIHQSFVVLQFFEPRYFEKMNSSTYASMTNLWVAINAPSRIVGTGLGTHEYNYTNTYVNHEYSLYGLNKDDGYSLLTRLFSEFGVVGVIVVIAILMYNYNGKSNVNKSLLIYFLSMFVRGGMYTGYGIVLFAFMYYYSGKRCGGLANESDKKR